MERRPHLQQSGVNGFAMPDQIPSQNFQHNAQVQLPSDPTNGQSGADIHLQHLKDSFK